MNKLKSIITDDKLCNLAHCSPVWLLVNTVLMTALACRCDKKVYISDEIASSCFQRDLVWVFLFIYMIKNGPLQ